MASSYSCSQNLATRTCSTGCYGWQKILVDNLEAAFHPVAKRAARKVSAQEEKITRLEAKLQQKNEVISELMEENIRAKKSIGEL